MRLSKALGHIRHDIAGHGLVKGIHTLWLKTRPVGTPPRRIRSRALGSSVFVRPGTADLAILDQFELHPYVPVGPSTGPINVLDLGANIGLSVKYWKHHSPTARIVAVEPDPANFAMLRRNTQGLDDVHLVQAGVWHKPGRLNIDRAGSGTAAYRTKEADVEGEAEATTIPLLMEQYDMSYLDILKVDIEGSELEVFSAGETGWIDRVRMIAIELHDRYRPGCGDAFFNAIRGRSWSYSIHGEMVVCTRRDG